LTAFLPRFAAKKEAVIRFNVVSVAIPTAIQKVMVSQILALSLTVTPRVLNFVNCLWCLFGN
jgi:hypothetical protein